MATPFLLTHAPVVVSAVGLQPIYTALDVSMFDSLSILVGTPTVLGTSASVSVQLWTGMQTQTDDGWVQYGASTLTFTASDTWQLLPLAGTPLRYLRWKVSAISGASPIASLFISGEGACLSGATPSLSQPTWRR